MTHETLNYLTESLPVITTSIGLLVGAVRVIPTWGFKLEVLDTVGNRRRIKEKPKITRKGHVIVPDGISASIGLFLARGEFQTCINIKDATTNNPNTSHAIITGASGNHLAKLSRENSNVSLFGKDLSVRYLPRKTHRQKGA